MYTVIDIALGNLKAKSTSLSSLSLEYKTANVLKVFQEIGGQCCECLSSYLLSFKRDTSPS